MARKLFDIDIDEITLCKSPAIRKKFFIKKKEEPMKELIESLKKFMAEDEDKVDEALTKEEIAKLEKLDDDTAKELKEALDTLEGYKLNDIPDDALGAIRTFAKHASCGHLPANVVKVNLLDELTNVEKAGARFSKATIEQLKKVRDIMTKLIGDKEAAVNKGHKELPDDVKSRLEELETLKAAEKERLEKEKKDKDEAAEARIKKLEERLDKKDEEIEALRKKKGVKTSIDGHKDDDVKKGAGGEENEDPYPSVYLIQP